MTWWAWLLVGGRVVVVVRRLRPDAAPPRAAAELPDHRALPLPARGRRARAAPVHRRRQRRREAVQPRSAAVDLHGGEAAEHLLRVRHRQRPRGLAGLPDHQAVVVPVAGSRTSAIPGFDADFQLPAAKVFGGARGRAKAFRAPSVVNISSMSYGSLGAKAIESLNRGAALAGCCQGTGEGGISPFHQHGGDLVWQIGTGVLRVSRRRGPLRPRPLS